MWLCCEHILVIILVCTYCSKSCQAKSIFNFHFQAAEAKEKLEMDDEERQGKKNPAWSIDNY